MAAILCPLVEVSSAGKEVIWDLQGKRCYLMLFEQSGGILAYHNVCPHLGRNLSYAPDRFLFDPEGRLVCPHHGALFDIGSGICLQGPCQGAALKKVAVLVEDGQVVLADKALLQA